MEMDTIKTNGSYEQHVLLDEHTAVSYAQDVVHYFDACDELGCAEIGDGTINYVFRVFSKASGKSLMIEQADTVLRSSYCTVLSCLHEPIRAVHYVLADAGAPLCAVPYLRHCCPC